MAFGVYITFTYDFCEFKSLYASLISRRQTDGTNG